MRHTLWGVLPCALLLALSAGISPAYAAGGKFKATRDITVDRVTGQLRKPNAQELAQLVDNLVVLTTQSTEGHSTTALKNGGVAMSLDGSFAGVMLARPNPDGTSELKCVFTFEEAAEFLGLVPDNSQE